MQDFKQNNILGVFQFLGIGYGTKILISDKKIKIRAELIRTDPARPHFDRDGRDVLPSKTRRE